MSPTFFSTSKSEEEEEDKEEDKEEEVKKKKTMTLIKVKNVLIIAAFVGHTNNPTRLPFFPSFSLFLSLCSEEFVNV
jgi:hypothetical protein|tara:strand:+ start:232 stop:462 length:231 start_codon:yes stop_codon:yes gene_type:complete